MKRPPGGMLDKLRSQIRSWRATVRGGLTMGPWDTEYACFSAAVTDGQSSTAEIAWDDTKLIAFSPLPSAILKSDWFAQFIYWAINR
jgi:hypothetical protein